MESKFKAFRDHDWDADPDWAAYLKRVEIPTNSAADLLKVKAKWWKRERDPEFDVAAVLEGTKQPPTSTSSSSSYQQQQQQAPRPQAQQQQQQQQQPRAPQHGGGGGAAASWAETAARFLGDPDQVLFWLNAAVLLGSLIYLLPLGSLSLRAYRIALLCCILSHVMLLTKQCGTPSTNMQSLQQWAMRAVPNQHFGSAISALMFLTAVPVTLVLAPPFISALYLTAGHVAAGRAGPPPLQQQAVKLNRVLSANRQQALGLSAQLDIALGFTMIYLLFTPQRSMLLAYFVWQQLRQRYWGPETGPYHRAAWNAIDAATRPIRTAAPVLDKPISFVQRWFLSAHPMAAGGRQ